MVGARLAPTRQPLGGAMLKIDRGGARADDDLAADHAAVPQRLDGGLPAGHRGHLVEQQQAGDFASGEIERPLHGRGKLGEMSAGL